MTDEQLIDLVKTVSPLLGGGLGGGIALLGVSLTNRFDTKKRRQEMLRVRGEELYILNEKWLNGLTGYFLRRASVMQGKSTYNEALDLDIAEGSRPQPHDFSRLEMLIDVYFPATRPAYDRVTAGRAALNKIASEHKRAYEKGDLDGQGYLKPFQQAMKDVDEAGKALKEAILSELRSI